MIIRLLRASILLLLLLKLQVAAATHLNGGEITYKYLDARGPATKPHRYQITERLYFDGLTDPDGSQDITISVRRNTATFPYQVFTRAVVVRNSYTDITQPSRPGCVLANPRIIMGIYITIVELPATAEGYIVENNPGGQRSASVTNLASPTTTSMFLSMVMQPPTVPNSSPVFSDFLAPTICLGDVSYVSNNAYDAEGDRLAYRAINPIYAGYRPGFTSSQPFGSTSSAFININTGVATYLSNMQGVFQIAIAVDEYRIINGREVLLGTTVRDAQVVVRACSGPPNLTPAFTAATLARQNFQMQEGQTIGFTITATDPDAQPLTLTVRSVLLDGPGAATASLNGQAGNGSAGVPGSVAITSTGSVSGDFQFKANCGLARTASYDVVATVSDAACNSKSVATVFHITVTRPTFPAQIVGAGAVCAQSVSTYTVAGPTYAAYAWTVRGGQVLGTAAGRSAQVLWGPMGGGTVTVRGVTPLGCFTDSVSRPVSIGSGLAVSGPTTYCRAAGTGLRYTVAGPEASYQWTITGGTVINGQGTNSVVVDLLPSATALLQVSAPTERCVTTLRIIVDDACLAFYNVITPNNDGKNDVFTIENVERHPNTTLTIFNRWGQQVYHSTDYHNTYGGESKPGVYYYRCQLADGTNYKGWFEVIP